MDTTLPLLSTGATPHAAQSIELTKMHQHTTQPAAQNTEVKSGVDWGKVRKTTLVALKWIAIIAAIALLTVATGGIFAHTLLFVAVIHISTAALVGSTIGGGILSLTAIGCAVRHAKSDIAKYKEHRAYEAIIKFASNMDNSLLIERILEVPRRPENFELIKELLIIASNRDLSDDERKKITPIIIEIHNVDQDSWNSFFDSLKKEQHKQDAKICINEFWLGAKDMVSNPTKKYLRSEILKINYTTHDVQDSEFSEVPNQKFYNRGLFAAHHHSDRGLDVQTYRRVFYNKQEQKYCYYSDHRDAILKCFNETYRDLVNNV
ncbi:MAG: hypothetical protein P0S95_07170 [Rhabdochlamydiaceae bacterium]|nr:hypothetical protein [Candidatus Amphrikana amoebophyrae]